MSSDNVILTVFALVGRPQQSGATRGHIPAHGPGCPAWACFTLVVTLGQ